MRTHHNLVSLRAALSAGFLIAAMLLPRLSAGEATAPLRADLIVRGGAVMTMDAKRLVYNPGFVAIRGDRIVGVGLESDIAGRWVAQRTVPARRQIVLPGLINAHTHAPMVLFRGIADDLDLSEWLTKYIFPAEARNVTRDFVYWGALMACWEMLMGGTTTYADMYYFEDAIAEATAKAGMRAILGETIIDFPSPDHKTPQKALKFTRNFIRRWRGHPLIVPAVAPHSAYTCSVETLQASKKLADEEDAPLLIHVAEAPSEMREVLQKYGTRPVPHLERIGLLSPRMLAAHTVHVTAEEIATLKHYDVGASDNPQSNMKLASGIAPVPKMLAENIRLGLGTDGAASNNTLDMFESMKTAALLHKVATLDPKVVSADEVLAMATINGARALHMEKEIGSLEVGKKADLIVVDTAAPNQTPHYGLASLVVYATHSEEVQTVIINGRVIVHHRRPLTLDTFEIRKRAIRYKSQVERSLTLPARN